MPTTVADLFAAAGLMPAGHVRWRTPVPERGTGIYVVARTDDPHSFVGTLPRPPLDHEALRSLLAVRPELRLDNGTSQPSVDELAARLSGYWLTDEVVLYIGLSGQPLRTRVGQYYATPLGARRPHAGGWWLKTIAVLEDVRVHYTPTSSFKDAETLMLKAFADGVSDRTRDGLHDPERVMPFANLRGGDDLVKRHGIRNATGDIGRGAPASRGQPPL